MVTLILYSRHVSALHGHHQVSVAMLNSLLYCMSQLHVASYRYTNAPEDCDNISHKKIEINKSKDIPRPRHSSGG
jgi:hypothetical protein